MIYYSILTCLHRPFVTIFHHYLFPYNLCMLHSHLNNYDSVISLLSWRRYKKDLDRDIVRLSHRFSHKKEDTKINYHVRSWGIKSNIFTQPHFLSLLLSVSRFLPLYLPLSLPLSLSSTQTSLISILHHTEWFLVLKKKRHVIYIYFKWSFRLGYVYKQNTERQKNFF